jgi:hypothetical protein
MIPRTPDSTWTPAERAGLFLTVMGYSAARAAELFGIGRSLAEAIKKGEVRG